MRTPDLVAFTGADDVSLLPEMVSVGSGWPVEFGLLVSATRAGTPRYPDAATLAAFREAGDLRGGPLRLAAHVCGRWAREAAETGASEVDPALSGFRRIQVNVGPGADPAVLVRWRERLQDLHGHAVEIILQCRDAFPEDPRVSWLFDRSGGAGMSPDRWPSPPVDPRVRIGYAGGLGPDRVAPLLRHLSRPCWIDMESGIRDARDRFDPALCREVCREAFRPDRGPGAPA